MFKRPGGHRRLKEGAYVSAVTCLSRAALTRRVDRHRDSRHGTRPRRPSQLGARDRAERLKSGLTLGDPLPDIVRSVRRAVRAARASVAASATLCNVLNADSSYS